MVAGLLFGSGFSALVYQTVWFREFRLIFGASTYATAAVLAIFMGGLGAGSAVLGRRADQKTAPLAFYGKLEVIIAVSAVLSLLLLFIVRAIYIAVGGSTTLGLFFATVLRLILSVLVLGIPTFLMGGTLPAAARAVEVASDSPRRHLALLYGVNTLGAVAGTLLSTFLLLEHLGNRNTLLAAAVLNLAVGLTAWLFGQRLSGEPAPSPADGAAEAAALHSAAAVPSRMVFAAAALVGFAFLLMELVWYRMLTPLLGGTTFTFGLILSVALLGIALGGAAYSFFSGTGAPTAGAFAVTCTLEALAIIGPYALGDRIALLAYALKDLGRLGFAGTILGWSAVTLIVVFPAAFIAGVQFPILVALLGRGKHDVGRHVGVTYAWNTVGSIAGSLAGGFGFLPLLSATGAWQLAAVLLAGLGLITTIYATRQRQFASAIASVVIGLLAVAGLAAIGPTAHWRHTGIGAGRSPDLEAWNEMKNWMRAARREIVWQADGRESAIAVSDPDDRVFIVNGKIDGSARGDASTQVVSGMIGALIHPTAKRALVVGLGTGSTAGWLGAIPSMERVDVVELEPRVLDVARDFAAVNQRPLDNPKVQVVTNDAREVLLASKASYYVIFSEPSNPYRAGIASLYTREFYQAVAARLSTGGVFLQWVQTYDIDSETIRTIYSTLRSVFPHVDTWRTNEADLVLLASPEPIAYDVDLIRRRLTEPPFAVGVHNAWRVESAEGVLSHFVGGSSLARTLATGELNTDDRTGIEFGFARSLGAGQMFDMTELMSVARGVNAGRPAVIGPVDWKAVELNKWIEPALRLPLGERDQAVIDRYEFTRLYEEENLSGALLRWRIRSWEPLNSMEVSRLAEVFAEEGDEAAVPLAERLRVLQPTESEAILARLRLKQRRHAESADHLERAFIRYRSDAWPTVVAMGRALSTAVSLAQEDRALGERIYNAMSRPFAAGQWENSRRLYRLQVAWSIDGCGPRTIVALREMEPYTPWTEEHLRLRKRCYGEAGLKELSAIANREWDEHQSGEPSALTASPSSILYGR